MRWRPTATGSGRRRRRAGWRTRRRRGGPRRRRPGRSSGRGRRPRRAGGRRRRGPGVSLTTLKSSRSRNRTTGSRSGVGRTSRALTCSANRLRLREAGQRVVVGLVAELLLEPRELGQRLLELAVLERDRGLVGERLEEAQVVVGEGRALGQAVGDQDRADHAGLAAERRDHRLADRRPAAARRLTGRRRTRAAPPGPGARIGSSGASLSGTIVVGGSRLGSRRPQRVAVRRRAGTGRPRPARPGTSSRAWSSSATMRRIELRRVLEDPAGLVEELEPLALLALGHVRAVGEEHGHERDDEQPEQARLDPQDRDGEQGQARVRDRDQRRRTGSSRAASGTAARRPTARSRWRSASALTTVADERRANAASQSPRVGGPAGDARRWKTVRDDRGRDREVAEVERELQRRLARSRRGRTPDPTSTARR